MQALMRFVIGESAVILEAFKCSTINQLIPDWQAVWLPKERLFGASALRRNSFRSSQLQSIDFALAAFAIPLKKAEINHLETYQSLWNSAEINILSQILRLQAISLMFQTALWHHSYKVSSWSSFLIFRPSILPPVSDAWPFDTAAFSSIFRKFSMTQLGGNPNWFFLEVNFIQGNW